MSLKIPWTEWEKEQLVDLHAHGVSFDGFVDTRQKHRGDMLRTRQEVKEMFNRLAKGEEELERKPTNSMEKHPWLPRELALLDFMARHGTPPRRMAQMLCRSEHVIRFRISMRKSLVSK
jgi:hypothetical protein